MKLKHINYYENKDQPNYWQVSDISLQQINLIIGINSTGKTRLLSVIGSFAKIIAQKARMNGHFKVEFSNKKNNYSYVLEIEENNILNEKNNYILIIFSCIPALLIIVFDL